MKVYASGRLAWIILSILQTLNMKALLPLLASLPMLR
ncbi:unnamed protein product [Arabidopsis halleri]